MRKLTFQIAKNQCMKDNNNKYKNLQRQLEFQFYLSQKKYAKMLLIDLKFHTVS